MRRHMVYDKRTGRLEERPCDQSESWDPMQTLHDCPECSAALARGERPTVSMFHPRTGEEISIQPAPLGPDGQPDLSKLGPDQQVVTQAELERIMAEEGWNEVPAPRRRSIFGRRPRWRDLKRGR